MKKIYISGKISGIEADAENIFRQAAIHLTSKGFNVVNPMTIKHDHDLSWLNYMKTDIIALMECDSIYMLSNWTDSNGAEIERRLAKNLGMEIIYQ